MMSPAQRKAVAEGFAVALLAATFLAGMAVGMLIR